MLYALKYYSLPLLLALALHAVALYLLYLGWNPAKEVSDVFKPKMVTANLIVLEPQAKPAPPPPPQVQSRPEPKVEPKSDPAPDPAELERKQREAEAAKLAAEEARKREEEARKQREREQRLADLARLAQSDLEKAIAEESANLQSGTEEQVAQSYQLAIYDLVRRNWSRPPSARNGMQARLLVELIPTGEVASVTIVEGSGSSAFDRSAEQAVRRAGKFEVPKENALFERYFRQFYFLFQPEDLLR